MKLPEPAQPSRQWHPPDFDLRKRDVFDLVEVLLRPPQLSGRESAPSGPGSVESTDLDGPAKR